MKTNSRPLNHALLQVLVENSVVVGQKTASPFLERNEIRGSECWLSKPETGRLLTHATGRKTIHQVGLFVGLKGLWCKRDRFVRVQLFSLLDNSAVDHLWGFVRVNVSAGMKLEPPESVRRSVNLKRQNLCLCAIGSKLM